MVILFKDVHVLFNNLFRWADFEPKSIISCVVKQTRPQEKLGEDLNKICAVHVRLVGGLEMFGTCYFP